MAFRRFLAAAAVLGGFSLSVSAIGADDDPGFVIIKGQKVATRIVPPREKSDEPAVRQVQDEAPAGGQDAQPEQKLPPRLMRKYYGNDSPRWRVREYSVGGATVYRQPGYANQSRVLLPHRYEAAREGADQDQATN